MDVTPALVSTRACVPGGQLVRFFGLTSHDTQEGTDSVRVEDLLQSSRFVTIGLTDECLQPEASAIVHVTGHWNEDGSVVAYEVEPVEDNELLWQLKNRECLQLIEFQASSAYKIARMRMKRPRDP